MNNQDWDECQKKISPSAIVFVWGKSLLSRIISWYQRWELGIKNTPTHAMIYEGGGNGWCISAEALGVRAVSLSSYKKYRIEVYSYKTLTVSQLQSGKDYAYGSVGRNYDYLGLFHFLGNLIKRKLPQSKYSNFCSELCADIYKYMGIEIKPGIAESEQTPASQWLQCVETPKLWKPELYHNYNK